MTGPTPFICKGRVTAVSDEIYQVDLETDASHLNEGLRVILSDTDGKTDRIVAKISRVDRNRVECRRRLVRAREKRAYPRLLAGVPIRYCVLRGPQARQKADDWQQGGVSPVDDNEWVQRDEFMNFSVTGLRFVAQQEIFQGDLLLVNLGIKGRDETWRCTAHVVRVDPTEEDPDGDAKELAVAFDQIPPDALSALSEMTLRIQEALL